MKNLQLARQLQLIERLSSPRGRTIEELIAELECSRRTIFRDLRCLEAAGIEVDLTGSTYTLAPNFGVVASRLFADELLALAMAAGTSVLAQSPDMAGLLEQALGKLCDKVPQEQCEQIARVVQASRVVSPGDAGRPGLFRKVLTALAVSSRLRVVCRAGDGKRIIHDRIRPVSLHFEAGQWAFGYRVSPDSETIVLPMSEVIDVEPHGNGSRVLGRHLLAGERTT
jgi:predicted DNA-binding transcriptional regulator YafY